MALDQALTARELVKVRDFCDSARPPVCLAVSLRPGVDSPAPVDAGQVKVGENSDDSEEDVAEVLAEEVKAEVGLAAPLVTFHHHVFPRRLAQRHSAGGRPSSSLAGGGYGRAHRAAGKAQAEEREQHLAVPRGNHEERQPAPAAQDDRERIEES